MNCDKCEQGKDFFIVDYFFLLANTVKSISCPNTLRWRIIGNSINVFPSLFFNSRIFVVTYRWGTHLLKFRLADEAMILVYFFFFLGQRMHPGLKFEPQFNKKAWDNEVCKIHLSKMRSVCAIRAYKKAC